MNRNLIWKILLANLILVFSQNVYAEDDDLLRVRASAGYSNYSLVLTGSDSASPDATSQYLVVGGGITYAKGNMYFDAFGSTSVAAEHDWPGAEGEFNRTDTALTGGYLLDGGWSVFGGYKWGKSEIFQDKDPNYKLTFEAFGPFGGASKAIGLEKGSSLSVSGAIALMEGQIYTQDRGLDDSGDAIGMSFTASYNRPLGKRSGAKIRGFYQYYNFTGFNSKQVDGAQEVILGISAGYYLNF